MKYFRDEDTHQIVRPGHWQVSASHGLVRIEALDTETGRVRFSGGHLPVGKQLESNAGMACLVWGR